MFCPAVGGPSAALTVVSTMIPTTKTAKKVDHFMGDLNNIYGGEIAFYPPAVRAGPRIKVGLITVYGWEDKSSADSPPLTACCQEEKSQN